jgi:hypothetical protein
LLAARRKSDAGNEKMKQVAGYIYADYMRKIIARDIPLRPCRIAQSLCRILRLLRIRTAIRIFIANFGCGDG